MDQKTKDFLRRVYRISGRASRSEYWEKMLKILILNLLYGIILALSPSNFIVAIVIVLLWVAQACIMMRRAQDLGWNGWFIAGIYVICVLLRCAKEFNPHNQMIGYALLGFLFFIWFVLPFVVGLLKPQMFANRYGEYQEDTEYFRPYFAVYLFICITLFFLWICLILFGFISLDDFFSRL